MIEVLSIDEQARQVADLACNGELSHRQARAQVVELIERSQIWNDIAVRGHRQYVDDVREELRTLLIDKALASSGGLNLHRLSDSSLLGWARQLCYSALASIHRNLSRRSRATPVPDVDDGLAMVPSQLDVELDALFRRSRIERALDEFTASSARHRNGGTIRTIAASRALCEGLDLTAAVRLEHYRERDQLIARLKANPYEAHSLLQRWLADPLDWSGVTDVWSSQTVESAKQLENYGPMVSHTLALAANLPKPRPSTVTLSAFRAEVARFGSTRRDRSLLRMLADSWVATEYDWISESDHTSDATRRAKRRTAWILLRGRWDELSNACTHLPIDVVPASPRSLRELLAAVMKEVEAP